MAGLTTSESDSNTFAGNIIYHTIFQSHYGHKSRLSEFTSTHGARSQWSRGACPLFLTSDCLSIPFRLQSMATLKEGDQFQMWEFIRV